MYLSDHPPFLGSPGTKLVKQFHPSAKNISCCTRTRIIHLPNIAFPWHKVYKRRPGRGFTEYRVHRQKLLSIMLLLLAVSLFAKVAISTTSVTRIFLWKHDATTFRFLKSKGWAMKQTFNLSKIKPDSRGRAVNVKEKEERLFSCWH